MSLNVSALTAYTDENKLELIAKSVLKGRTIDIINLQSGIKNSATINTLNSNVDFQAGACGWNAAGTTILSQRTITVCPIKLNESTCLDTLETYYTSKMMRPGSYNEEIPFEQLFADEKAAQVSSYVDSLIWNGDTTSSGDIALCDGFLKLMRADGSVVDVTSLDFTASGIVASVNSMVAATPTDILDHDDLKLFMGYDKFQVWTAALRTANNFHFTGADTNDFKQYVPGTNVEVIAVKGLNGIANFVLTAAKNLYVGVDMLSDMEDFAIFYSEDNDEVRTRIKFKVGVNYAFSDFVVLGA
jgi:hypothetical protein